MVLKGGKGKEKWCNCVLILNKNKENLCVGKRGTMRGKVGYEQ